MSSSPASAARSRWVEAWPDALAFAGGLAVAWFAQWQTRDLVWSLWLSSLVVGYATLIWLLTAPLREFLANAFARKEAGHTGVKLAVGGLIGAGVMAGLAFFTFHFGMFHFVHSVFLNQFFPIVEWNQGMPLPEHYLEVVRRYWIFLPAAFLAERAAFASKSAGEADDGAVTAEAIARRKARNAMGGDLFAPYKNVIRMHLLIFFFAGAAFAKLDNFAVYAVVYAAYFFPWRLVRRPKVADDAVVS
jgi:hypothetical protein